MRRFFGAVFIGLGALLLVAAGGLVLLVGPAVTKLPYNMQPCPPKGQAQPAGCLQPSVAEATGATFLEIDKVGAHISTGDLRSTTEVIPQAKTTADEQGKNNLTDSSIVWDVYNTAARIDNGTVISASSTELALDRATGAAVDWKGQWISESQGSKDTSISYKGEVYKFPFSTEKKDYAYWDPDTRTAPTAKFSSVDTIEGVQTYHFIQTIADTPLTVADSDLGALINTFATTATSAQVIYSNTREVWVDPATGSFIKVREQPRKTLKPNVGATTTLLNADFVYTTDTIKSSAQSAKDNGFQLSLVTLYLPIGCGVLGLVLLVGAFVMLKGRRPGQEGPDDGVGAPLPPPRHSLRGEAEDTSPARVG